MIVYSMKNFKWKDLTLGESKCSLENYGCYIVSLSILLEIRPDTLLKTLNRSNCFTKEGKLLNDVAAKVLGCTYEYSKKQPEIVCIAETDHFAKKGFPQHFFVIENAQIIDPLDGRIKQNPYNLVSFRIWEKRSKA